MTTPATALVSPGADAATDFTSFIEVQLPVSKLSKECYKERKANAGQTLTALGSYWKGRKPLILVRAVILGLLLPAGKNPDRDREIFLKLMLMDEEGRLKRKKRFDGKMVARVMELLPEGSWARAIELTDRGWAWKRGIESNVREAVEIEAFLRMGLDEQLRHCLRPEELPDSALDDVWGQVSAHLGTSARSLPELVEELGVRRFGKRPHVGDPFCGGGSIPFEAARLGCDVYASDLNPIACLLTWGALNIVGGSDETRERTAQAQNAIIRAVDEQITRLGIEHDGDDRDLRLLADAPSRWPHGYRVTRGGDIVEPDDPPHTVTCPRTGWRVPMLDTRQVSERHKALVELSPIPADRSYAIEFRTGADDDEWDAAKQGTVVRADGELFLVHDPGDGESRARIANRAKAYLYCLEVEDPNTGWRVPLAPSWVISKNYRTVARLVPDHANRRFEMEVEENVSDEALEAAARGTVLDGDLDFEIDGEPHQTSMERLRGEVRLKGRYRNPEEEARDRERFESCRNRYSDTAANDLRLWELSDIVPRPGDVFQERLYAIQWLTPDGRLFFTSSRDEDMARENRVEHLVRASLADWQAHGLLPDSRIEPGDKTDEPIRTRGWTHWHHLFTPRHLLIGALVRSEMIKLQDPNLQLALALVGIRSLSYMSRLTRWNVGFPGRDGVAPSADTVKDVFYNQALNTFFNFGARAFPALEEGFAPDFEEAPVAGNGMVEVLPASAIASSAHLWITDPPYADAIHYHEITEYFIAWLSKSPPRRDWIWDTRRELAIRGESASFRRSMVEAYSTMAKHMPDNGLQVVMFTHQDVGVWADLAEILWAAGLRVTSGWCVATETESATRVGNYVQGTVLLVLRKRIDNEAGFIARLQRPVEDAVHAKLTTMRGLDKGEEPNFGDADYQLGAYAAALEVLTRYGTIDGRPVAAEVLRERHKGEESEVERLLRRAVRIASDFLVPDGLARDAWNELGPEERFYVKGLDLERAGEARSAAYQEMARGFGVESYRPMLGSAGANKVRLKTAGEFGRRDLKRAGSQDRAEDRELERFAGGLVRHVLYGIHAARESGELRAALDWFAAKNLPDYWSRQQRVIELLDYIGAVRTPARTDEAETARALRGAVDNHRP
jgi:adenine-specific DNA methylase